MNTHDADTTLALVARVAAELGSVPRLSIVQLLLEEGPSRVRGMAEQLGMPEPTLSNHLRRLRTAGLVAVTRSGTSATYEIANPHIGSVIEGLLQVAGGGQDHPVIERETDLSYARSCYDHLAGEIGVQLTAGLLQTGAIEVSEGTVRPGPDAGPALAALGVGLTAIPERRKASYLCSDWTHGHAHLAGALGAAILQGLLSKGWAQRVEGSRRILITDPGREGLAPYLQDPLPLSR